MPNNMSHDIMSCRMTLCHVVRHCVMSYDIMSCRTTCHLSFFLFFDFDPPTRINFESFVMMTSFSMIMSHTFNSNITKVVTNAQRRTSFFSDWLLKRRTSFYIALTYMTHTDMYIYIYDVINYES